MIDAPRSTTTPVRAARRAVPWLIALAPAVGILGFLGAWQAAVKLFSIPRYALPAPWDIITHLTRDPGFYVRNGRTTTWEAFCGFVLGGLGGLLVATAMAHSRFVERAVLPLAVLIQVTPVIAYAPAVVIWVGFGLRPILIITITVCFVPFLINAVAGLRSVDPLLLELARSVDAGRWEVFARLRLPSALPHLFAAGRISVGLALIGAVLGEFFGGVTGGLGYAIKTAQSRGFRGVDQLWGSIFTLALIGAAATLLITTVERFVLHWHASQRT